MNCTRSFTARGAGSSLARPAKDFSTMPLGFPSLAGKSNRTTGTSALAQWAAIWAPITPAPSTATLRIFRLLKRFSISRFTQHVWERPALTAPRVFTRHPENKLPGDIKSASCCLYQRAVRIADVIDEIVLGLGLVSDVLNGLAKHLRAALLATSPEWGEVSGGNATESTPLAGLGPEPMLTDWRRWPRRCERRL